MGDESLVPRLEAGIERLRGILDEADPDEFDDHERKVIERAIEALQARRSRETE